MSDPGTVRCLYYLQESPQRLLDVFIALPQVREKEQNHIQCTVRLLLELYAALHLVMNGSKRRCSHLSKL